MPVYLCKLCRRSVFCARRKHVYEKGHRERLQVTLRAFTSKITAARKMIHVATVEKFNAQEHTQKFWCHCCEEEVTKHASDGNLTVLYGGLLEHVNRPEHKKAVNKFWWTHQADVKLKPKFVLSDEEYERFKSSVTKALEGYEETEDVLIKQMAEQIEMVEKSRQELVKSVLEPTQQMETEEEEASWNSVDLPCSNATAGHSSESNEPEQSSSMASLTYIGHQMDSSMGNLHTGAVPPWMMPDEDDTEKQEIGPALDDFIKHQKQMALKKLPPNRVGANFDHNAPTDEGWLPSFGRVWNSGRRWQSRHQYRKESNGTGAKRKK
ncbi:centrosomal AT-AC splicing factor isoform X1 [Hyperolius riggenbachi]|uniref:centrosomal AT-AC splicing factor isoform X1 n=1 Tax=Hyperolius riggenbachi TaxID=752182 RepID=UPI0035A3AB23